MLVMLCLLSACFPEPQTEVEPEEPAEEVKPARTYYTLRLGDTVIDDDVIGISVGSASVSASASRALIRDTAVAFHEFFEVVFFSNGTVARAAWDLGKTPELHGVYRTDTGINYGNVTRTPPDTDSGSALLFVGTKDDKTLLALGRLIEVDNGAGVTNSTVITSATVSVTFEVAPITAGVRTTITATPPTPISSFRTGTQDALWGSASMLGTVINLNIYIHYNYKTLTPPLFNLQDVGVPTPRVDGLYNFTVDAAGAVAPAGEQSFDRYKEGIILKGSSNVEKRNPRYFVADGQYNYSSTFVQDTKTTVVLQNNGTVDGPFENPVRFRFSGIPNDGSVFALTFEIFVYNLTTATSASNGPAAERWRISPGIGSRWLDLDDGAGGQGGAIFLGSGDVAAWMGNVPGS